MIVCLVFTDCTDVCPEGQTMTPIVNCVGGEPNGCGAESFSKFSLTLVDLITTKNVHECCDAHDECFATCGAVFMDCEDQFRECLNSVYKCWWLYRLVN